MPDFYSCCEAAGAFFGDCAFINFFNQCVLQTTNGSLSSFNRQNGVSTSSSPTAVSAMNILCTESM